MNYTEVEKKIFETLSILRNHPGMILSGELTYVKFEKYLHGYTHALGHCSGICLGDKIRWWFQEKTKQRKALYWTTLIEYHYKNSSEEERINILIDVVEEFFQENPKWYL